MLFKVTDNNLLEKYTKIWRKKISSLMNIEFDSELVYWDIDKCIETKIKVHKNKVNTNFQGKEVPKQNASYDGLSVTTSDSFIKVSKIHYPQTLLEECRYELKRNKRHDLIHDDLELDINNKSEND